MTTTSKPKGLREVVQEGKSAKLVLNFHEGQRRVWNSQARFVFMLAGTQGGKTAFAPHWLHREISRHNGEGDYLAVASNYDQFKLKMLPEMREVFEGLLGIGRYWAGERIIELARDLIPGKFLATKADEKMWGRIILRSAEAESGLEAMTARAAWLDEVGQPEFTAQAWEAVLRRLSLHSGRVLGTTTLYQLGWLKTEVYDRWTGGDKDYEVVQFDSTENPQFPVDEFLRAKQSMPLWKFNMFYRGLYEKPAGMVYDSFDETACVIDRFPVPPEWPIHVGHDFGGANPAALLYAQDPLTNLFYLFHEYFPGAKPTHDQVEDLKKLTEGRPVIRRIGGSHQEDGWRNDYTARGWPIQEPTVRDVAVGIGRVYAFHKRNAVMVFRDCTNYLGEKMSYSYKLGDGYQVLDEIQNKSTFHLMDAERYVIGGYHADNPYGATPFKVVRSKTWR